MTDSEIIYKLVHWSGYYNKLKFGEPFPDYLNDDAAAMSLLDTLVEKGYDARLQSFLEDHISERWQCSLWQIPTEHNNSDGYCIVDVYKPTRREAVVAACLELIEKEASHDV